MWALILTLSCYYGCKPIVLPERYNNRTACEFVGRRAIGYRSEFSQFICINTDSTGAGEER